MKRRVSIVLLAVGLVMVLLERLTQAQVNRVILTGHGGSDVTVESVAVGGFVCVVATDGKSMDLECP